MGQKSNKLRLIELRLKNFKGLKSYTMRPDGEDIGVYGENGTGKTTVFDAFTWLLFGKDSRGKADFDIKPLDANGVALSGVEHSVEGIFSAEDGDISLKKIYKEQWAKKRGNPVATFTGHTTDYYINGVPGPKKLYDDNVAGLLCDEETFKIITSPLYFNESLTWGKRRELLLDVCGDVSQSDVIGKNKKLERLPEIVGSRSLENHRMVIAARKSEINKKLIEIPQRIDEVNLGLPEIAVNKDVAADKLNKLKSQKSKKEQVLARIEAGGETAKNMKELSEVEAAIIAMETKRQEQAAKEAYSQQAVQREVEFEIADIKSAIRSYYRQIDENTKAMERLNDEVENLRTAWHEIDSQRSDVDDNCPACGQPVPVAILEEARAKFNLDKATRLEENTKRGRGVLAEIDRLSADNKDVAMMIMSANEEVQKKEADTHVMNNAIPPDSPALITARGRKSKLEKSIDQLKDLSTERREQVQSEIDELEVEISETEGEIFKKKSRKIGEDRIAELKQQEKTLAFEFELLESDLYVLDEFNRAKVSMLEEKINNKFQLARFKLFKTLINGGVSEMCETTYLGVPFSSLNNGARINIGLDIISTLSEHYGVSAPVWIDNRESVSKLLEMPGQVISLYVSEPDKKLRIVTKIKGKKND